MTDDLRPADNSTIAVPVIVAKSLHISLTVRVLILTEYTHHLLFQDG